MTTDDDIREWWFRWRLDRYRFAPQKANKSKTTNSTLLFPHSMLFGFCFAYMLINISSYGASTEYFIQRPPAPLT